MTAAIPSPAMPAARTPRARGDRAMPTDGQRRRRPGWPSAVPDTTGGSSRAARTTTRRWPAMASAQGDPGEQLDPAVPQEGAAHPDQGADGRGQDHRVVRVDDALGVAEDQPGQEEPAPEEQEGRPGAVGAGRPAGHPQDGHQADQRTGDQPGDLAAERLGEQPVPSGRAPHGAGGPAAADAALLVAAEAADAVVAEDQVEDVVVGRAPDVRPGGRRGQLHDGHPPAGRHHEGDAGPERAGRSGARASAGRPAGRRGRAPA